MYVVLTESDFLVCPSIISITLGAGVPPSALHDTIRS